MKSAFVALAKPTTGRSHAPFLAAVRRCGWALLLCSAGASAASAGDDIETSGSVLRVAIPVAAYAMTFVEDDAAGRTQFYRSFGANALATLALKELISKSRPDGSDDDAFPSGHASMAFQGASFIHRRYGMKRAWPAYALATYTGWTRLDADEHDEADVLAGALLGIASSMLLVDRFESVDVAVNLDGQIGLQFSGRFE